MTFNKMRNVKCQGLTPFRNPFLADRTLGIIPRETTPLRIRLEAIRAVIEERRPPPPSRMPGTSVMRISGL